MTHQEMLAYRARLERLCERERMHRSELANSVRAGVRDDVVRIARRRVRDDMAERMALEALLGEQA